MSIERFISDVKTRGVARTNRYEVNINPPVGDGSILTLACEETALPGRGYSTSPRAMHGPVQYIPYDKLYNEIAMTFRCSREMTEKKIFDDWLAFISPSDSHEYRFFNSYVSDITINQLDEKNSKTYGVNLYDAYPTTVTDLGLSQNQNEYHRLQVTFRYTRYVTV